jgi:hypothetical protein
MNRRRMMLAAIVGSAGLGLAALVGLAAHYGVPRDDDDEDSQGAEQGNRRREEERGGR